MHLSLYRKFRPDRFEGIVRQEHVVRILKNQIKTGTVGHAYLFTGPRGTGKTSVARIFARAVNCENPQDGSPCGVCETCRAMAEGSLDITEIDAASNNGVAEMRDLREKVQYPPVTGKYKVYIVDEVHMLTDSAFNALLKTLEEPPAHALFILATTEPQKLPATILSRCMRLDFKLIPEEDLEAHLMRILDEIGKPYEREAVSAIARAGAGSDRDMLSIAEMCIAYGDKLTYEGVTQVLGAADFNKMCELAEKLLASDGGGALEAVEGILAEGKSVGVLMRDLLELLSRITVAKTCANAEKLLSLPKEMFAAVKELAEHADGRTILRATEILARTETDLRLSTSPRILFESAVLRIGMPQAEYDIDALMTRMAALEKKVETLQNMRLQAPVQVPAQAPVQVPVQVPVQAPAKTSAPERGTLKEEARKNAPAAEDTESGAPSDEPPPLMDEPVFDEAFFSDGEFAPPASETAPSAPEKVAPVAPERPSRPARAERPAMPAPVAASEEEIVRQFDAGAARQNVQQMSIGSEEPSAEMIYGRFMRLLRKNSRNGVLFTLCADLAATFEDGKLILLSDSETVSRMLNRDDHRAAMTEIFSQLGVEAFEVRYSKAEKREDADGIEELKRNFKDYPIDIK